MATKDEDKVRERAYSIWEREGRPEGRQGEHWRQAEEELGREGEPRRKRGEAKKPAEKTPATRARRTVKKKGDS